MSDLPGGAARKEAEANKKLRLANEHLFKAARGYGGAGEIVMALSEGADLHALDDAGATPLLRAAECGDVDAVKTLARLGARLGDCWNGYDALSRSAISGRAHMVELLLSLGVDPGGANPSGWTPLMHAANHGGDECVRMLIEAGAPLNPANKAGRTSLMMAARNGSRECVEMLLAAGAELSASLEEAREARAGEHVQLAEFLSAVGAAREEARQIERASGGSARVDVAGPARPRL